MCPHHVTSTEIVLEAPWTWLTGSQEEAGACGCSSSVRYHGLSPPLWLLPQQHSRAVRDLLLHQTGGRNWCPRTFFAQLPPSRFSSLWLACPGAGLSICCCWTLCGSCQPFSPACHCPSEEQPCPPAHHLPQALYHPQTGQQKELSQGHPSAPGAQG